MIAPSGVSCAPSELPSSPSPSALSPLFPLLHPSFSSSLFVSYHINKEANLPEKHNLNRRSWGINRKQHPAACLSMQGLQEPDCSLVSLLRINQSHTLHMSSLTGHILTRPNVLGKVPSAYLPTSVLRMPQTPAPQFKPQGKWGLVHLTW